MLLLALLQVEQILLNRNRRFGKPGVSFLVIASFTHLALYSFLYNIVALCVFFQTLISLGIIYYKTRRLLLNVYTFEQAGFNPGQRSLDFRSILTGLHLVLRKLRSDSLAETTGPLHAGIGAVRSRGGLNAESTIDVRLKIQGNTALFSCNAATQGAMRRPPFGRLPVVRLIP